MQESYQQSRRSSLQLIAESPEDEEVEDEEEYINENQVCNANDSDPKTSRAPNPTHKNVPKSSLEQQSSTQPPLLRTPPLVQVLSPGAVTPTNEIIPSVNVGEDDKGVQFCDDTPGHSNELTNDLLLKQISILANQVSQHYL